jgi:hypothetical protein
VWCECGTDQRFIGAEAIERSGVEVAHAQLEGTLQQGRRRCGRRRRAVGMREIHAAQADFGDLLARKCSQSHRQIVPAMAAVHEVRLA